MPASGGGAVSWCRGVAVSWCRSVGAGEDWKSPTIVINIIMITKQQAEWARGQRIIYMCNSMYQEGWHDAEGKPQSRVWFTLKRESVELSLTCRFFHSVCGNSVPSQYWCELS